MKLHMLTLMTVIYAVNCVASVISVPAEKLTLTEQEGLNDYLHKHFPAGVDELTAFSTKPDSASKVYFASFVSKSYRGWSNLCKVVKFSLEGEIDQSNQIVWRKSSNYDDTVEAWLSADSVCQLQKTRIALSEGIVDTLAVRLIQDSSKILELARVYQNKNFRLPTISTQLNLPLIDISTETHRSEMLVGVYFEQDRESTLRVLVRLLNDSYEVVDCGLIMD